MCIRCFNSDLTCCSGSLNTFQVESFSDKHSYTKTRRLIIVSLSTEVSKVFSRLQISLIWNWLVNIIPKLTWIGLCFVSLVCPPGDWQSYTQISTIVWDAASWSPFSFLKCIITSTSTTSFLACLSHRDSRQLQKTRSNPIRQQSPPINNARITELETAMRAKTVRGNKSCLRHDVP